MPMTVKIEGDGLGDLKKGLAFLKGHRVLVGIPEASGSHGKNDHAKTHRKRKNADGKSGGKSGSLTNVALAFIMTNGSPKKGIPPRPFLEPAIEDSGVRNRIAREMGNAVTRAANGDLGGAMNALNNAGMIGRDAVKDKIGSGVPPPNKPATIRAKGSGVTLIDTANMQGAVTYVIE